MNFPELVEIHNAKLAVSEPTVDIIGNTLLVLNASYNTSSAESKVFTFII